MLIESVRSSAMPPDHEVHTQISRLAPVASRDDLESTFLSIGCHLHLLGDAVSALAKQNSRSLLDSCLESCGTILHEVLNEHSVTWVRAENLTEALGKSSAAYSSDEGAARQNREPVASSSPLTADDANGQKCKTPLLARENTEPVQTLLDPKQLIKQHTTSPKVSTNKQGSQDTFTSFSVCSSVDKIPEEVESAGQFIIPDVISGNLPQVEEEKEDVSLTVCGKCRKVVAKTMGNRKVETIIALLIVGNAGVLGYQADRAVQDINAENPPFYRVLDLFFTISFTAELSLRIFADGLRNFFAECNRDRNWNIFDAVMVLSAIMDEIVGLVLDQSANISAVRIVRMLRLVRVIRVVRVMRMCQDLRLMVAGIIVCLKPLTWALALLFLIIYCFSVVILQFAVSELASDSETIVELPADLMEQYGSLVRAIATLYKSISGGLDWGDATEPLMFSEILPLIFGCYVAFALFCCLNIFTGVFVENAHRMSSRDDDHIIMEEMKRQQYWLEDIRRAFTVADVDDDGVINQEEFKAFHQNPRMQAFLRNLGVSWSWETADWLFKQLDFDNTGTISFDEFIQAVQRCSGASRDMDMVHLMHDAKIIRRQLDKLVRQTGGKQKMSLGGMSGMESQVSYGARSSAGGYFTPWERDSSLMFASNAMVKEKTNQSETGTRTTGGLSSATMNTQRHEQNGGSSGAAANTQRHEPNGGLSSATTNTQRHEPNGGLSSAAINSQRIEPNGGLSSAASKAQRHDPILPEAGGREPQGGLSPQPADCNSAASSIFNMPGLVLE